MAIFSFDPVKTITCIDGGALVVRSQGEVDRLHEMRLIGMSQPASRDVHGRARVDLRHPYAFGYRYHMANLHAAIGLASAGELFDRIGRQSLRRACRLLQLLGSGLELRMSARPVHGFRRISRRFSTIFACPAGVREELRAFSLANVGIDTGIHWTPGHWFTLLNECRRGDVTVTEKVGREILSLPLHAGMSEPTLNRVVNAVADFFGTETAPATGRMNEACDPALP